MEVYIMLGGGAGFSLLTGYMTSDETNPSKLYLVQHQALSWAATFLGLLALTVGYMVAYTPVGRDHDVYEAISIMALIAALPSIALYAGIRLIVGGNNRP